MTRAFRLAAPQPLEQALQRQILAWLRIEQAQGRVAWFARCNGGMVQHEGRDAYGKPQRRWVRFYTLFLRDRPKALSQGMADIHGMLVGGRYFAVEVKRPGEAATPEQAAFLAAVQASGGLGAVVHGFEDAQALLRGAAAAEREAA